MVIQAKYYLKNNKNINKNDLIPFFDSALRYINENYKVKSNRKLQEVDKIKNIDEIEQILLYLNK